MKPREVMRLLHQHEWFVSRITGSHYIYRHPTLPGRVTVAFHNRDIPISIIRQIEKDSGIRLR